MPFASINGNRLYIEDTGGDGPAVIFSHGFLLDHTMWDAQVEGLRDRFRCIRWDERSHGMSECNGPFTHWDAARDCMGVLDTLGVDQAALVGMSQGGFLSMRAALLFPERVRCLALVDTAAHIDPPEVIEGYRGMQKRWTEEGPTGEVATINADLIFGPEHDYSGWVGKWRSRPPTFHNTAWNTVIERDDISQRLGEITCPSLVFNGTEDQAFDMNVARGIQAGLGDCKGLIAIEGAYHAPNITHPHQVTGPLREFLAQYA